MNVTSYYDKYKKVIYIFYVLIVILQQQFYTDTVRLKIIQANHKIKVTATIEYAGAPVTASLS